MKILTTGVAVLLLMPSTARAEELRRSISRSENSATRPNILFIDSDDHGWGDLPSNWDRTEVCLPTLDALAASMKACLLSRGNVDRRGTVVSHSSIRASCPGGAE